MTQLEPLVGDWDVEVDFDFLPEPGKGWMTIEWELDRQFLLQRSGADHPAAPTGLCIIAPDGEDAFTQHYYDSRGVVRLYAMRFDGLDWTLERTKPDFAPLKFSQRYTGRLSDDGSTIEGRWQTSQDGGATWELDFELTYRRRAAASGA